MIFPQISGMELFSGSGLQAQGSSQGLVPVADPMSPDALEVSPGEGFGWFLALVNGASPAPVLPTGIPGQALLAGNSMLAAGPAKQGAAALQAGNPVPVDGKPLPPTDDALTELLLSGQAPADRPEPVSRTAAALSFMADTVIEPRASRMLLSESQQPDASVAQESEEGVLLDFKTGSNTALTKNSLLPAPLPASPAQQPDFNQAVGQRLLLMVQNGSQDARMKVHPANLGSIDIQLSLDGDEARLTLSSPNSSVRDALDLAVPRLREMFGETGVSLGQVNVGAGDSNSPNNSGSESAATGDVSAAAESEQPEQGTENPVLVRQLDGLVDTFA